MINSDGTTLDKTTASRQLAEALSDGANLLGTSETSKQIHHDLKSILESRLTKYFAGRGQQTPAHILPESLTDIELLTAREALSVVERIQQLLAIEDDEVVPIIGTRDLSQIKTLLSLVFKWGTEPLLGRIQEAWPNKAANNEPSTSKIVDLTDSPEEHKLLSELTLRLVALILPDGVHGKLPRSLITTTLLNRYLTDMLLPSLALGWLPKSLSTESMPVVDKLRPLIMRLLSILPTSQTINSLGSIISGPSSPPAHVHKTCISLLSRQILRSDGVQGFFSAAFGEEDSNGADLSVEKLEHVARVLTTVPANTSTDNYFSHVAPRIIALVSEKASPAYRKAAAFTISRMLSSEDAKQRNILEYIHNPLLQVQDSDSQGLDLQELERVPSGKQAYLRPDVSLNALLTLLANADPSPTFIPAILSPIIPSLYSLSYHLDKIKTSDPQLKSSIHGMLLTWGKIVTSDEGITILWTIIQEGRNGHWKVDLEGHIHLEAKMEQLSSLSLLTPDQVPESINFEDPDFDANIFDLYPDPLRFVKLLKEMDRGDISSDLFVKLLENYRGEKSHSGGDSLRILLYLQIIMQMQKQLSEGTTSNILKKPQQILAFIYHVLDSANPSSTLESSDTQKFESDFESKLKFTPSQAQQSNLEFIDEEADSDDEMDDSKVRHPDEEQLETAITLLLSVLEADEDLSARTMPILNDIFLLLESVSLSGSIAIRPLAREARLVMTARLAYTSTTGKSRQKSEEEESAQLVYQKALKLLQDPILPVRAHGLLLLRQLVTPVKNNKMGTSGGVRVLDPALTPAILSIFLQSVQDEDSYIFLNSVQGLAAMVDGLGKEVLKGLVNEYADKLEGLGASVVTQQDVDIRTRVGEALSIVIKKCGDALGIYVDILVPPLFKIVRTRDLPTTLRTSAVSILSDCVKTYPLSLLGYIEDLASAMIDLLQVESVPIQQALKGKSIPPTDKQEDNQDKKEEEISKEKLQETMDNAPTSTNSKFPPLRRAALHFLGLLITESTRYIYEASGTTVLLTQGFLSRASITLGYIASTDEDDVVRVMAREAKEGLGEFQKAKLGL